MPAHGFDVHFFKMHGSGNDFVLIDNRELDLPREDMESWAKNICRRSFGVGADGLIFLDLPPDGSQDVDYVWHFYNADGSRPEMCGNGSRCTALLAHVIGLAPAEHTLGTDAGPIKAVVYPEEETVKVQLTPPVDLKTNIPLEVDGHDLTVHFANTGVPHTIVVSTQAKEIDLPDLGRSIRFHPRFSPSGTNVNFIEVKDREHIYLRTYERGVEAETFACGTGAAASVLIAHELGLTRDQVHVTTSGGEHLEISMDKGQIFLQGKATLVYKGIMSLKALNLK